MLKDTSILGHGHVFFVGITNDVVMGLPIGISSITYLVVAFFASYVKMLQSIPLYSLIGLHFL